MAFIQTNATLGCITCFAHHKKYMNKLFEGLPAGNCNLINFAADRYDFGESSLKYIKSEERAKQFNEEQKPTEYQPADNVKVPE